jgi:hypothetical protein
MLGVNVVGGTRAGWRRLFPQREAWSHHCATTPTHVTTTLPRYMIRCVYCGARRP